MDDREILARAMLNTNWHFDGSQGVPFFKWEEAPENSRDYWLCAADVALAALAAAGKVIVPREPQS